MDTPLGVYAAINAVQTDLNKEGITKNRKNTQQNYSFRGIDDFPDYLVSDSGKIYSKRSSKFLKPRTVNGYHLVTLCKSGAHKQISVHVLVATAFLGDRPVGFVVNHKNGSRIDNNVSNIEWVSQSENVKHAYRLGLRAIDDFHRERAASLGRARRVCSPEKEFNIFSEYKGKRGDLSRLSRKFGVSIDVVRGIVERSMKK